MKRTMAAKDGKGDQPLESLVSFGQVDGPDFEGHRRGWVMTGWVVEANGSCLADEQAIREVIPDFTSGAGFFFIGAWHLTWMPSAFGKSRQQLGAGHLSDLAKVPLKGTVSNQGSASLRDQPSRWVRHQRAAALHFARKQKGGGSMHGLAQPHRVGQRKR